MARSLTCHKKLPHCRVDARSPQIHQKKYVGYAIRKIVFCVTMVVSMAQWLSCSYGLFTALFVWTPYELDKQIPGKHNKSIRCWLLLGQRRRRYIKVKVNNQSVMLVMRIIIGSFTFSMPSYGFMICLRTSYALCRVLTKAILRQPYHASCSRAKAKVSIWLLYK